MRIGEIRKLSIFTLGVERGRVHRSEKLGEGHPPDSRIKGPKFGVFSGFLGYYGDRLATLLTIRLHTQKSMATPPIFTLKLYK